MRRIRCKSNVVFYINCRNSYWRAKCTHLPALHMGGRISSLWRARPGQWWLTCTSICVSIIHLDERQMSFQHSGRRRRRSGDGSAHTHIYYEQINHSSLAAISHSQIIVLKLRSRRLRPAGNLPAGARGLFAITHSNTHARTLTHEHAHTCTQTRPVGIRATCHTC